ncbi:potassium channel family protein [Haloferula sp.]|uniref:potassium channel family protein n=1 Tax=Haloferula sp. TaxID=2497595 RepID=UPI003C77244F
MSRPLRNLVAGLCALALVFLAGVSGYVIAGWPLLDAIYMVILTVFSVGYGEVRPIDSTGLMTFTVIIIVLGCTTVIYLMGAFVQFLTEGQILNALGGRRMSKEVQKLTNHVIVCGYGRVGRQIIAELESAVRDFVVIDRDLDRLTEVSGKGHYHVSGDATDEKTLLEAGIERAQTLASVLPSDAANVFITLSARNLNPKLRIIARGDFPSTEAKLLQAGADKAVLPTHIGAERIAGLILRPDATEFLEQDAQTGGLSGDLAEIGVQVQEMQIPADSDLVGATLAELETRGRSAFLVVAVRRADGSSIHKPPLDTRLDTGDTLIVMCHQGIIPDFTERLFPKRQIHYRGATS